MPLLNSGSLTERFHEAREIIVDLFPHRRRPGKTYTAFSETWISHSNALLALGQEHLCQVIEDMARNGNCWKHGHFVLFASDGTRANAPRTAANQQGLGCCGRDVKDPQVWMTLLIHLGTGLPWAFEVDRGDSSERHHLKHMLGCLPAMALLIADAGYCGYDLWWLMMHLRQAFLIRVGSNVTLIKGLQDAGLDVWNPKGSDRVYLWPKNMHRRWPPLELRLIELTDNKHSIYLVTNVLDDKKLSGQEAAEFYKMRWGIELWFRSMKQTMEARELHSHAPVQAKEEMSWTAMSLTVLGLMHVQGLIDNGLSPSDISCSDGLKVVRRALRKRAKAKKRKPRLIKVLGHTLKDQYQRKGPKITQPYPRKKTYRVAGPPNIQNADAHQLERYKRFREIGTPLSLTA